MAPVRVVFQVTKAENRILESYGEIVKESGLHVKVYWFIYRYASTGSDISK